MTKRATEWIPTETAAELSGYSKHHVRRLVRSGRVVGQRFGAVWQVDKTSLVAYMQTIGKLGARRGPKGG